MTYVYLALAIFTDVLATLLLKASNGWEQWWLGAAALLFYTLAGIFLAIVLRQMSVSLAYAIWSGVGIALVCIASILLWQQNLDGYALSGIMLIFVGTLLITTKSNVVMP